MLIKGCIVKPCIAFSPQAASGKIADANASKGIGLCLTEEFIVIKLIGECMERAKMQYPLIGIVLAV